MDSILNTIKKMLGDNPEYDVFDTDIIIDINSVIMILRQMGVGKSNFYGITGSTETWSDLVGSDKDYEGVKTYIYLKVKKLFDPPTSSMVQQAMEDMIKELEYRLYQQAEYVDTAAITSPTTDFDLDVDSDGNATIVIR